ncbi:hypothetical protein LPW11_09810 [Geomonas sp. RF6]|uniref:hypothetical protein n=1 Tax=Geomonas sp. RF6 TaxID=2897342 RepID=UPI001E28FE8E|nr:hypothetical protein [Geomonas sp. RF6]UFS72470.1 hypothetical protein LPW11_09810 [Geomonas sp. RF6]
MRIFKPEQLAEAIEGTNPLGANELFFVELWYSMTHQESLDSYRVKCMNSRMLIREWAEELAIGRLNPSEASDVAAETISCLSCDPVIATHFERHWTLLEPVLQAHVPIKAMKPDERKQKATALRTKEFVFVVNDLHAALEKDYWRLLSSSLPHVVATGNKDTMRIVTSHAIADLVDRGWPIESLFTWHDNFLKAENREIHTFEENLSFMMRKLSEAPVEYQVTLRLTGSKNLVKLGRFGDFVFMAQAELKDAPSKFTSAKPASCLAQTTVMGADPLAAAIIAKESFEQVIDLLRFDYEPSRLKIGSLCHVRRVDSDRAVMQVVRTTTPNPTSDSDHSVFSSFVAGLKTLSERDKTEEISRRKIRGAIRQYRFGRDSENYKDKFLNWWLGLEAVANVGGGEIGPTVTFNVSRVMALPYLVRLLVDALTTIKYARIDWHADLRGHCDGKDLQALTIEDLFSITQSPHHVGLLLAGCIKSPTMHYRCEQLFTALADPSKTLAKIDDHTRHLEWQMARLYRIRCCIVHGAEVRFRLSLFAANLEFYLKETTKSLINGLNRNGHVYNVDEIFSRSTIAFDRLRGGLDAAGKAGGGPATPAIRQAVFARIVV